MKTMRLKKKNNIATLSLSSLFAIHLSKNTSHSYSTSNCIIRKKNHHHVISPSYKYASTSRFLSAVSSNNIIGNRIEINESFDGLKKVYSDPDVFIIENFLDEESCKDLIEKANEKKLDLSPVAYAGKTDDKNELISLAAKGPVAWLSILTAWYQLQSSGNNDLVQLGINVLTYYAFFFAIAFASITAFIEFRADELQTLRTSSSTTLDNLNDPESGTGKLKFKKYENDCCYI